MTVYLRGRPLSLFLVVHANIPLRLLLRNAIRQSSIHRRSIAASAPLLPAKATEGAGGLLLLRSQCCTVTAAVVPLRNAIRQSTFYRRSIAASTPLLPAKATEGARALLLLRPQYCTVAAAVVPLLNSIRQSIIRRRSIAASAPLLPAKATEGGVLLLLRPQCCTVAAAVVSHEQFRTITMTTASVQLYKCHPPKKTKCTNLPCAMCLTVPSTASAFTSFFFRSRRPCLPTSAFAVYQSLK